MTPLELDQANCAGQPRRRVAPHAHKLDMENQRVTVCETYPCTHARASEFLIDPHQIRSR
jgi:hypothetical protein